MRRIRHPVLHLYSDLRDQSLSPRPALLSSHSHFQSTDNTMADPEQDLLDYEEEDEQAVAVAGAGAASATAAAETKKGGYVSIHSSGFRDFLLKPELLRAIVDCGFEHPSEVQHECIPQAILGMDILCQAKSGMGKTAVFVLATLQQLDPVDGQVSLNSDAAALSDALSDDRSPSSSCVTPGNWRSRSAKSMSASPNTCRRSECRSFSAG